MACPGGAVGYVASHAVGIEKTMRARPRKPGTETFFNEVLTMATMQAHTTPFGTRGEDKDKDKDKDKEQSHQEGPVARAIEEQTAKVPSDVFMWAAGAAIVVSLGYQILGSRRGFLDRFNPARAPAATFVGMWVPTLLLLGIYNKIVKVAGSDRATSQYR
jgi:hypothetical protein